MHVLKSALDLFLHLDKQLDQVVHTYGTVTYFLLTGIVFAETGLVVTPFFPGDSLLFAAGALAGRGLLNPGLLVLLLMAAALVGDNTNYFIGKLLGPRVLRGEKSRLFNRKHLDKTHAFFERYGGKTIIIARFVPIVRTFTPFVAGVGVMTYPRFLLYSIFAAALWVNVCVWAGYFFGGQPFVKEHFSLVVIAIVLISLLPALVEILRHRMKSVENQVDEL